MSKRQSLLWRLVPNLFKDKIQQNQHSQQQPQQSSPAGSWWQLQRFPTLARGLEKECSSAGATLPFSRGSILTTLRPYRLTFQNAQVFWHCRKQPLLSHVCPFPPIEPLLKGRALTWEPGRLSLAQKKHDTMVQNVWFLSSVTAILRFFFFNWQKCLIPGKAAL